RVFAKHAAHIRYPRSAEWPLGGPALHQPGAQSLRRERLAAAAAMARPGADQIYPSLAVANDHGIARPAADRRGAGAIYGAAGARWPGPIVCMGPCPPREPDLALSGAFRRAGGPMWGAQMGVRPTC